MVDRFRFLDNLVFETGDLTVLILLLLFSIEEGPLGAGLGDGGWEDVGEREVISTEGERSRIVEGGGLAEIISGSGGGGNIKWNVLVAI